MIIKEGVFDRIEQSFVLFKDNFIGLFLPMFLYNFISLVVVGTISQYYLMKMLSGIDTFEGLDMFSFLNNPSVVMLIAIAIFLFLLYLLLYIVILLGFIKSVRQAAYGEEITILDNVKYGVLNFFKSMKTYWYIFAYVALIPALIFIVGGVLMNIGYYVGNLGYLGEFGGLLMVFGAITFLVFAIYRGTKAKFALYSAVEKNEFTQENFNDSVNITDNNWWRIIGNFLLVGLLVSLIMSAISGIISLFSFFAGGGVAFGENLASSIENSDPEAIINSIKEYTENFSIIAEIFRNLIDNILSTAASVFLLIFTYIFFKRLEGENNAIKVDIVDDKIDESKENIEL